jgi:2-C-methyl-D-erythritol 4-phosphate cytidylyltransferase
MAVALVVAAGRGERLGSDRPKAFVMLAGRPMLDWSVDVLRRVAAVDRIVVALPPDESAPEGCLGVPGGRVRSESVRAALAVAVGDPVLVHDAARPLIDVGLVQRVLAGLDGADCAVAASPVVDTVKQANVADGIVERTLDRSGLWAVQTPQVFARSALERALAVEDDVLAAATDDAWLVERLGGRVRVVEAPRENLKVTTRLDLRVAEMLLADRGERRAD